MPDFVPQPQSLDTLQETHYYQPSYQVRFYRHTDGLALHDVYNLRGDIMSITFGQRLADPAATWALTLPPHRKLGRGTRLLKWSDVASPMDYVEIDIRRRYADPWVTIMRGFVDNVFEADVVDGGSGSPQRRIVLNGRNFGKLWLEDKIFYLQEIAQFASGLGILERYWGIASVSFTPAGFLTEIWQKIGKPKLEYRRALNPNVPLPVVSCTVPDEYQIFATDNNIQAFQGPLWNLFQAYANPPYTEFLVRDVPGDRSPSVLWRWAPLLTRGNKLALPDHGPLPKVHTLHTSLATSYSVGTSDNDRYTYFWATPGGWAGQLQSLVSKIAFPGFIDGDGINLYGYKDYQPVFSMYAIGSATDPAAEATRKATVWGVQLNRLTGWLVDSFIWAVEMREGTIDCHLEPDICVGDYLDVPEEGLRFYVEGVGHTLVPGQFARTSLTVTRGLRIDDPSVERPTGYDPKGDAPIPGGSRNKGPATPVPTVGDTAPYPVITQAGAAGVAAEAEHLARLGLPYRQGTRAYLNEGIAKNDYAAGIAAIRRNGIDCSELVDWCYFWGAGVRVPPTAQVQFNHSYRVNRADLQPGDMVFFDRTVRDPNPGEIVTHSGIFIGGNQMVNAQNEDDGVRYANIDDSYWGAHYYGAGRLAAGTTGVGNTSGQR